MRGTRSMSNELLLSRKAKPAHLVIADDHELVRAGLRAMLTGQRGLEVVGEAANGREALMLCRRLQPDLALIDVRMPEQDGLATCCAIKEECPAMSVSTVKIHVEHILSKLGVSDRTQAAVRAIELGLLQTTS